MSDLSPMKDPASAAVGKLTEEAVKTARDYLDKLLAPGLEESGGIISDTIAYWRLKNKVNLILKAKRFLEEKGVDPKRVLPNVMVPLLEAGSLESNDEMQNRWASLLASAAEDPSTVPPSFPRILADLSPREARIVDWMEERVRRQVGWVASEREIRDVHKLPIWDYEVLMGNLSRLNLCAPIPSERQAGAESWTSLTMTLGVQVEFTRLGAAFVRACRGCRT